MRRDKRVIVEREGKTHLPGGSSKGFKRIQADNASINVFLGGLNNEHSPPAQSAVMRADRN